MGWTFNKYTFKELLRDRCASWTNTFTTGEHVGKRLEATCLKHCFKGNPAFKGHLWTVWEHKLWDISGTEPVLIKTDRFIGLDLIEYVRNQGWGYKDLSESAGLCEIDCPISYLDMVPLPESEYAGPWRQKVRERAEKRSKNRKMVNAMKPGDRLKLVNCMIPEVTITSVRPLRGTYHGVLYNIPGRLIGEKIEETEDATR